VKPNNRVRRAAPVASSEDAPWRKRVNVGLASQVCLPRVCVCIDRRLLFVVVVPLLIERPCSRNAHKVDLDLTCRRLSLLHLQYGVAGSECSTESSVYIAESECP
jgi:hypothetical protein